MKLEHSSSKPPALYRTLKAYSQNLPSIYQLVFQKIHKLTLNMSNCFGNKSKNMLKKRFKILINKVCIFCQIEQCASQHHPRNENKKQLVKHETSRTLCHNELSSSTLNLEDAIRNSWNFKVSSQRLVNF